MKLVRKLPVDTGTSILAIAIVLTVHEQAIVCVAGIRQWEAWVEKLA
jgi:hypothetical protein